MNRRRQENSQAGAETALAERLHSAALRLIRRLAKGDAAMGLSRPKASALSVLTFGGPMTLKDLAAAEQVRAPTMSRLVAELEAQGLATKTVDIGDRRVVRIAPTPKGRKLLLAGRDMRVGTLGAQLAALTPHERATLDAAAEIIVRLNRAQT
jgi:DNA-binding MarR family transcriptional regulator